MKSPGKKQDSTPTRKRIREEGIVRKNIKRLETNTPRTTKGNKKQDRTTTTQQLIHKYFSAKPRASLKVPGQETVITPGNGPMSEGGVTGQRMRKEKEDNILLGNRLRPPEVYEGPDKSLKRARGVEAKNEDRKQEGNWTQGGRKLPSFEEERPAGSKEKRLGERRT